jgi:signal transduction histidine kinase/CheY-like chemotaxis protein
LPQRVESTDQDEWGIAEALRSRSPVTLNCAASDRLPGGVWPEPTTELLVLPLFRSGHDPDLCGILIVGANPRIRLDASYSEFLRLVAAQFESAISALQSVHREREARADAQRAARMRDEFLATLSHELRSPLNAVLGWTQILKSSAAKPELVANAVDVIDRNARLQARLVTDLLDISRAISGNLQLELQDVDVAKVVAAAIESVVPTATAKSITVTTALDPNQSVRGDPTRIEQMLWNLLSNAVKFTPKGGEVAVVTRANGRYLSIQVSDNGEGMDPAFVPHLFERFRQADSSAARRHEGVGLGLAIVKQLAELQQGRVSGTSDGIGRGSTFVIELPRGHIERPPRTAAPQATGASSFGDHAADLSGVRVLLVDDQQDALLVLERIFESAAARARLASCAEDALEMLSAERFDVIVSDIAMPGMDGYDLVAELRRRGIDTPAIALTAFALPGDVSKAATTGFSAHIAKPIDRNLLLATVARLTRNFR